MTAYYNEIDPYAAQWLRNLIAAGHIAPGHVDERSISDVRPGDLLGYTQCHFFAGIGVWSYALRRAGWPDDRPVWTGSCPCQPFSAAGAGEGFADERHLWPHWNHLIGIHRPPNIFGEQVASKDGLGWLDLVQADMEGADYACWPVDLCAAGVGAPHIRQRLWFTAVGLEHGVSERLEGYRGHGADGNQSRWLQADAYRSVAEAGTVGDLADRPIERRCDGQVRSTDAHRWPSQEPRRLCATGEQPGRPGPTNGPWGEADWLLCRDGRWRPVEPGTFPLAHGAASRVGRLRAYGNAIVAEAAEAVIATYLEAERTGFAVLGGDGSVIQHDDFESLL